jgi:hypothetical protein
VLAEDHDLALKERFANLLVNRGNDTQKSFQKFLQKHKMSSHVWIWAKRPEER